MLVDTTVLYFIHGIELSLEDNEVTCLGRVLIKHVLLELIESIDDLEEVALSKEEFEILEVCLLYTFNQRDSFKAYQ